MKLNLGSFIKRFLIIIAVLIVTNIVSNFFFGFVSVLGGNIEFIGLNSVAFDPLITIAYMMLFYFMTVYYQPKNQFYLFLFTLFLSFTANFIQGSIFLLIFFFALRKLNYI